MTRPESAGVAVWRIPAGTWSYDYADEDPEGGVSLLRNTPGRWYPEPYAAALEDVVECSKRYWQITATAGDQMHAPDIEGAYEDMIAALDRLDAAKAGDR